MKIWTVTTDDNSGTVTQVFGTAAAADAAAFAFCKEHWSDDYYGPMPATWQEAYEAMEQGENWLWMTEHDITAHPAINAAIEATAIAEHVLGKLGMGQLNLRTDRALIIDAYDAIADANCLLRGSLLPDPPIYATRADLAAHPAFADLDTDDDGNPLVWENHYCCQSCTSESVTWQEAWSCQCDAHCPECDAERSADESVWLGPDDPALIALWEDLPEAG